MNVLPLKMMFMRRPVLIISKVMSEKEERVFLKVVKLGRAGSVITAPDSSWGTS